VIHYTPHSVQIALDRSEKETGVITLGINAQDEDTVLKTTAFYYAATRKTNA
jgi:hypothetical protein